MGKYKIPEDRKYFQVENMSTAVLGNPEIRGCMSEQGNIPVHKT